MKRLLRQIYDDLSHGRITQKEALAKIKAIKMNGGVLVAAPAWQDAAPAALGFAERHVVLCGLPPVDFPAAVAVQAGGYSDYALACFDRIRTILRGRPEGKVLFQIVTADEQLVGLSGMLRTASLENPLFAGQVILVSPAADVSAILQAEASSDVVVRYGEGTRQVLYWQEIVLEGPQPVSAFRNDGVYLITGGAGSLGVLLATEVLARTTGGRVVLASRSDRQPLADGRVSYRQADVTDAGQVAALIAGITAEFGQLNGIVHCAGVIADNFILKKTDEEFASVLAPKVAGTIHLDAASAGLELDFFVLFSSFAGAMGNIGQADYAAANGFMDRFAASRNTQVAAGQRQGRTRSIDWPLWRAGGMAVDSVNRKRLQQITGMQPMTAAVGMNALDVSLVLPHDQLLVADGDLVQMRRVLAAGQPVEERRVVVAEAPVQDIDPDSLIEKTEDYLRRKLSGLLKVPSHKIDPQAGLEKYGIDSILAMKLTGQLEQTFGSLPKTLFFEYQTIADLTRYLVRGYTRQLAALFAADSGAVVQADQAKPARRAGRRRNGRRHTPAPAAAEADPIVIIGLSGRYPNADDVDAYWENLRDGKDCIIEVPKERWDWREYFSDDRTSAGDHYSKWGGFISGVDEFDPLFFNISPKEAKHMDPQERLFLQHAWMAIEDAGYTRAGLQMPSSDPAYMPGQAGVYVGVMYTEYQLFGAEATSRGRRMGMSASAASIANRVSFAFNLHGPSMTLDTMCSSSLTAIHLACQDLMHGHTNLAIAGGVNVSIHPNKYLVLSAGQFISSDGHCQSFGEGGDGYIPGEGVGAVVLKRLSDAQRDGDHIYAIIRGSALNHGGRTNGYTVPNPQAQATAITRALVESKTDPRHISYIEAHGTGTKLGDPIEIAALSRAFNTEETGFCLLGSAKSNIGHCESAAGIAGLTKVLLQMQHGQIAPSLHSAELNPLIDFPRTPFIVNQTLTPWEQPVVDGRTLPRIAGISSFGAGGSNAHLLVEEYQQPARNPLAITPVAVVLSARTAGQLRQKAQDLLRFMRRGDVDLVSVAYTLQIGREAMAERLAFIVGSVDQLVEKLQAFVDGEQGIDDAYQGEVKRDGEGPSVFSTDADLRQTVDKWMAGGKLAKLLELWVGGLELDWVKLYGDAQPQRISLPTYPFAKDRYWIDLPARPVVTVPSEAPAGAPVLHPLLHTNTSDLNQQSYSTTFTGSAPITAAVYLEMARVAVQKASLRDALPELHEVVWVPEPLAVNGSRELHIALRANDRQYVDFEIYTVEAGQELILCQGRASWSEATTGTTTEYVLHTAPLQAALDVCGSPTSVRSVRILAPYSEEMRVQLRDDGVDLTDEQGNVCVELRGVTCDIKASTDVAAAAVTAPAAVVRREIALAAAAPVLVRKRAPIALSAMSPAAAPAQPSARRAPLTLSATQAPAASAPAASSEVRFFDDGLGAFSIELAASATGSALLQALEGARQETSLKVLTILGLGSTELDETLHRAIASFPYPVIAVLQDDAIGSSFLAAALCDFMVCNEDARYAYTDARLHPTVPVAVLFAERFGDARAQDFLYRTSPMTGRELRAKGWTAPIVPAAEVEPYARTLATTLAAKSRNALRLLKQHLTRKVAALAESLTRAEAVEDLDRLVRVIREGDLGQSTDAKVAVLMIESERYSDAEVLELHRRIAAFAAPVVAAVTGNAGGNAWLLAQCCDAAVYSATGVYSAAGIAQGGTALFTLRFGNEAGRELVLTGADYTGAELQRRTATALVAKQDRVLAEAMELAQSWAALPRPVLASLKEQTAAKLLNLPVAIEPLHDAFAPVSATTAVRLQSKVVSATAYPDGVVLVKIEDRDAKNMFSDAFREGLREVFAHIEETPAYKVVVLTGYDSYFASGGTKENLLAIQQGRVKFTDFKTFQLPFDCTLPVIAAMQGHGIGAGLTLGLFSDLVVLSEESRFVSPYMNYGFTPGAGATYVIEQTIGADLAREGLLTGQTWAGREWKERGVTLRILPRAEVQSAAMALASQIARQSRGRLIALKQQLTRVHREPIEETYRRELVMHDRTFVGQTDTLAQIESNFHQEAGMPQAPVVETLVETVIETVTPSAAGDVLPGVVATLKTLLANELQLTEDDVNDHAQFVDLGLDSIAGVTWIRKINEKYQTAIEATKVYSYPTLAQLARHVAEEAEKSGTLVRPAAARAPVTAKPATVVPPKITPAPKTATTMLTSWRNRSTARSTPQSAPAPVKTPDAIAVIGMAGQFPRARNVQEFWRNLAEGRNCISEVPRERWDVSAYYQPGDAVPGKTNSQWLGALEEYDRFDPLFFNISPTEAEAIDPQQRLFLQACWQSIEDAGYDPRSLSGSRCGVYAGCAFGDYHLLSREQQISVSSFTGDAMSILAARASYFLNLQGPCLSIDTACSSSLVAIANACDNLVSGVTDLALAGGVYVMAGPEMHIRTAQAGMLSRDGRCFTFDQRADGFVPGEAVGVVMLKRLADAERDGDHVYGVIQGWGVNQDGKTNGITAPNPDSQTRLQQSVYDKYRIDPANIQLIEAHGTGTRLGDPIEVEGLKKAFARYTKNTGYCALGSVKSNIGHTMPAAGITGVIKLLLALQHKQLPPTINFERLNEHIALENSPFYVNDHLQEWELRGAERRQAAISSFGFGGTNAHIVIGEYVPSVETARPVADVIVPLSARTDEQLRQKAIDLLGFLRVTPSADLAELAWTLQTGRAAMDERLGFVVTSVAQLTAKLEAFVSGARDVEDFHQGQVRRGNESLSILTQNEDIRKTVTDNWIANRKLAKLLELWAKGLELDWSRFWDSAKPKRLSLPVYPFAKDRYWIDTAASKALTGATTAVLHPLLHTNTSDLTQQSYSATFTGEEFFLTDHQVRAGGGVQKVLPGVAYLEMARAAIANALPIAPEKTLLELHDTAWVQPVVVGGSTQVSIALTADDAEHIDFEIYSEHAGEESVHCQGRAVFSRQPAPAALDLGQLASPLTPMDVSGIYPAFARMGLHYGPAFQGIAAVRRGHGQVLAELRLPKTAEPPDAYVLHPSLLDSALQACIGLLEDESTEPRVPFALDTLRVIAPCTAEMCAWVRYAADGRKLDIDLADAQGNICAQLHGFSLRVLNAGRASVRPLYATPAWQPAPLETSGIDYAAEYLLDLREWNDYTDAAVTCLEKIQAVFQSKPQGRVLFQVVVHDERFAGLTAMLQTASLENPHFIGQVIVAEAMEDLGGERGTEPLVRYEHGRRSVVRWQEVQTTDAPVAFQDRGVYLITGGTGAIGMLFAREILARTKHARVIVTGRAAESRSPLAGVSYRQVDLADGDQVRQLVASIRYEYGQLDGILHCAGMTADNYIVKKSVAEVRDVLAPKVAGTINLDEATREVELDFFVLFSSFAAAKGNAGQADYAAANAFMDRFAAARNVQVAAGERYGRTRSINWPLWQEGGIALDETTRELLQKTTGIQAMQTATGLDAFHRALALPYDQILVVEGDLARMRRAILAAPAAVQAEAPAVVGTADASGLFEKTQDYLRRQLSSLLKMPPHGIDPQAALETYGIDSILAMKLTAQLEQTFGPLSRTLFFEYQTIRELTGYFVQSHGAKVNAIAGSGAVAPAPAAAPLQEVKPAVSRRSRRMRTASSSAVPEADPIAIIGLSGRYPEAVDVEAYWENLRDGKDCITEVPKERWDWKSYFTDDRTLSGHHFSKWGGFISGVDEFDPLFFNIAPKDAKYMDPQERLFLQHAWMAIEDAGYTRAGLQTPSSGDLAGQVGVYAGVMYNEYQLFGADASARGHRMGIAGSVASIANRVSYVFNLHGPSVTLDTMCSSSLTAIHFACQDLKLGRTSLAIAGGVNVTVHPNKYLVLSAGQFISSDGHCQSFGEGGDGYIPGEGVGVVVLKRLSEARRDGDHIYGIIRGSALNHGGKTNGYTVPNPQAQATAISRALAESKTDPRHVSYIEAHGTGTKLGDPIEIAALSRAFNTNETGFCLLGSAKSNIGHCESAAGVAGLTKVLMQMQHRQIAPSLHSSQLNPHIDFDRTPFVVNQTLTPWEQPVVDGRTLPRIAGISSFGAGGSNAHLIIEEYAEPLSQPRSQPPAVAPVAILLSARTAPQLRQKAQELLAFVRRGNADLVSVAYTLQTGREAMDDRIGFIVGSVAQLIEKLEAYVAGEEGIEDAYQGQAKRNSEALSVFGSDSDLKQTIENWIAGGKLARLVDLWVKGLELDWTKLYRDAKPQRISLPTYPFAKEHHWVDIDPGAPVAAAKSAGTAVLHPLLHSNTSDLSQQSYSTTFTGDEPFLKDRRLPAAAYLEMARVAVQKAARIAQLELRDVVWSQPLVIDEPRDVSIALFAGEAGQVHFEIYGDDDTVHCQGRALSNMQPAAARVDGETVRLSAGSSEFVLDPGVLDAALAACGAPSSIESLRILARCTGEMQATVRDGDVDLRDAQGNVCVQLRGVSGAAIEIDGEPAGEIEIERLVVEAAPRPKPMRREIFLAPLATPEAPVAAKRGKAAAITLAAPAAAALPQPPASRARVALSSTTASFAHLYDEGEGIFSLYAAASAAELRQTLHRAQQEPALEVLLLHGLAASDEAVESLVSFPYPVIAVLPGDTVGAGFLSAALCDFMICSEEARYGVASASPAAMKLLRERFGNAYRATVATARAQGWTCPIVPAAQVETTAQELAATLAGKSQEALRLLKQHLTRNLAGLAEGITAAVIEPRIGAVRVVDIQDLGRTSDESAVVLRIEDQHLSDEAARKLQLRIVESPVPVIAALTGDASGNAWLVAQFCDGTVYSNTGVYSSAKAQASTAAAAFAHRLGNEAAREILLTAADYSGAELQRRAGVLVAEDVVAAAIHAAESWGSAPRDAFTSWIEERPQSEDASPAAAPVALRSTAVTVTAHPDGVVVVKMEDRQAKNMFSDALRDGVAEAFAHIAATPAYKVVVLTGYDSYFASGGTKESLLAIQAGAIKFTDSNMFQLPLGCSLPVIAAMQGHGIGAGWSLGMFADIAIMSEESRYVSPYMQYGFTPGAGATWSLRDKMGQDLSRESLLTAQPTTGRALKTRGVRLSVLPRAEVLEAALAMAKQVARQPRGRLLALKQQLTAYAHEPLADTLRRELAMHETTFVGRSDTLSRILDNFHQESEPAPAVAPQPAAAAVVEQASDSGVLSTVTEMLKSLLASELQMSESDVEDDAQFVDMGLDSISGVTWIRKINEQYQTAIEATKVYSFPTLAQLSRHVAAEAAKLGTLPGVAVETAQAEAPPAPRDVPATGMPSAERASVRPATAQTTLTSRRSRNARFAGAIAPAPVPAPAPAAAPEAAPRTVPAVAVIGMAGQFPQAKNIDEFWQNLAEGKNCVTEVARERWDVDAYYQAGEVAPGKTNSRWLGALDEYDHFDPAFFNISPTEAAYMDPQQRLFLQAAWHSIEHAGYDARVLAGSNCGVFVGCATGDYHQLSRAHQLTAHGFTGSASSVLAGRISYFLDLQGPCVSIDTACSSSLVAIAQACDSLVSGVTDLALAGGVYVMAGPEMHIRTAQAAMLSPDGKCFTFDQRANGFVPGEGAGVVVLKRLEDAKKDGDTIYGVIQGWGVNQDGRTNGITAPNPESQTRLLQEVYEKYEIDPAGIQLIEAHGTGTKLGDPIELEGLKASFRNYTSNEQYCAIGSVKSNIGHCLTAAGIAGVIKLLLALQHKQLPPTIHFEHLNEHADLAGSPFYVNTRLQEWELRGAATRQSAISSFGFSGTNAHLVIGEYEASAAVPVPRSAKVIIPLSARTPEQLRQKAADLLVSLRQEPGTELDEVAFALQTGRSAMDERLAFVVSSIPQLIERLQSFVNGESRIVDAFQGQVKRNKEAMALFGDSDLQHAIDKWFVSRKLGRLADLWVRGMELDWNKLYGGGRPRRVSVPLYPFAKDRYWIDAEREEPVVSTAVLHPLLHSNASDLGGQRYRTTFTGDEAFLAGGNVLPAAAYLEMVRAAVEHALPPPPEATVLELHGTEWAQPIVIDGRTVVMLALQANDREEIEYEISTEDGVVRCQGRALFAAKPEPVTLDVDGLTPLRLEDAADYVLHPRALESVPASLQTLRILAPCTADMYVSVRGSELDLCDEGGNVCVQMYGLSTAAPAPAIGSVFATPVWEAGDIAGGKREYAERHVILRELGKADYGDVALACFERIQSILRDRGQGKVLVQIAVADPLLAGLAGLLRTAAQEHPRFFGQLLLVPSQTTAEALEALLDAEQSRGAVVVRYVAGNRQVLRWQEVADEDAPVAFREDGVYLITGGTGGLGLLFAEEILTKTRTARVILTGRSSEMRDPFSTDRVSYRQLDLANLAQVEEVIAGIGHIDGVLHCAGALVENSIANKSAAEFARVLEPKVAGTLNLDLATRCLELDFFVLFSSIAGAMGNPRTADYAAANAFLDQFAVVRNEQVAAGERHGRTRSIDWPVWQSGTMGTDAASQERLQQATGMLPMQTASGMHAFHRSLALSYDQLLVVEGNQAKLRATYLQKPAANRAVAHARKAVAAPQLQERLQAMLGSVLGLQASRIDLDHAFSELGLDSFLGTELVIAINKEYGTELAHIAVFDYPNVRELARFLEQELKKQALAVPETVEPPVAVAAPHVSLKTKIRAGRKAAGRRAQTDDRIAIIGMSGRYPEAADLQQYWENLAAGKNSVGEVPRSRWDANRYYDPNPAAKDKAISKWLGAVADVDCFDPLFFRISPQEAEYIDPHHRLFLEESYKAFEDAGYSSQILGNKKCGVYLGVAASEYPLLLAQHRALGDTPITSNHTAIAAARIAYYLNLKGPAISVDTACSSSLVAIHLACQGLLAGETDMALAGGVAVWLTPESFLSMTQAGMLSPTGQCKAFDDSADGIVVGDGVGAVVLKRLADAEADGDSIYGVILGSGINQDGRTNGITAPSVNSQIELERGIYDRFEIEPSTISYVEAHGTGTKLGDPIELEALATVFRERSGRKNFCAVGSVKSNIGHTTSAAGVAGVQKVLLSMRNRTLVPTLHVTKENARFDFSNSPFYVSRETKPWDVAPGTLRRAAVSSFGFSGTNAHVVIEEYPETARPARTDAQIVPLSARTPEQLRQKVADLRERIAQQPLDLASVAYTLQTGREAMEARAAFVVNGIGELAEQLAAYAAEVPVEVHADDELQQLAAAWVSGLSVDWNQLHGDATPQRVSLPAYPFAREHYWIGDTVPAPGAVDAAFDASMKSIQDVIDQIDDDTIDTGQLVNALKLLV